jgi:acetyl esterase/lipase
VTNPHARYLAALQAGQSELVDRRRLYWSTDEAAIDGSLNLILERGEPVDLPPLLITQGTDDQRVPIGSTREFVERYRQAGGEAQLLTFEGLGHGFLLQDPSRAESVQQATAVVSFIDRQCAPR